MRPDRLRRAISLDCALSMGISTFASIRREEAVNMTRSRISGEPSEVEVALSVVCGAWPVSWCGSLRAPPFVARCWQRTTDRSAAVFAASDWIVGHCGSLGTWRPAAFAEWSGCRAKKGDHSRSSRLPTPMSAPGQTLRVDLVGELGPLTRCMHAAVDPADQVREVYAAV